MALKFSMILQAVDRATAPMRRVVASTRNLTRSAGELGRAARRQAADVDSGTRAYRAGYAIGSRLRGMLDRLVGGFRRVGSVARAAAGRAGLGSWGQAAETAGRATGRLIRKMGGMIATTAKWAAGAATAASGFALFDLFKTAGQFEQYQIMLENMEGSAQAARKAFAWVKQFAQKTPYELADVMEAFVKLKSYGIDPMDGSLRALGDGAAGMSKDIMQAVEALADAVTGEYERLKEFGITASTKGEQVTLTYRKAGKELHVVAQKGLAVQKALIGIFDARFAGMMDRQSGTLNGMISNLKDSWSNFLIMVADAGIFDMVKQKVGALLTKVNQLAKDGTLQAWAEKISGWLEKAFNWAVKFIEQTDWKAVGHDLQVIGGAAMQVANAIVRMADAAERFKGVGRFLPIVGGVTRFVDWATSDPAKPAPAAGGAARPKAPATQPARPRGKEPKWLGTTPSRYLRQPAAPRPAAAPQAPALYRKQASAGDVQVGGRTVVDINVRGPAQASVRSVQASNRAVPLQVNLGKTMASAA